VRETCTPGSAWGDGHKGHAGSVKPRSRKGPSRRGSAKATASRPVPTSHRVNHDLLMGRLAQRVPDARVLRLIRAWLNAGVLENGLVSATEEGTPQGGPLSPLLSNIVLHDLTASSNAVVTASCDMRTTATCTSAAAERDSA